MSVDPAIPSPSADALLRRTVHTALACLEPRIRALPKYRRGAVWERLAAADLFCSFPVIWTDDRDRVHADRGFLAEYAGCPCHGRLLFRTGLTGEEVRALAFLWMLEARLRGVPDGIRIWGVDREPARLSDSESMRLCRGLLRGLNRCLPRCPPEDPPLAGAPAREQGYLAGALLAREPDSPLSPFEAAGAGLCFFADAALRTAGQQGLYGRTVVVSGDGSPARAAARMAGRMGARMLWREPPAFPDEAGDVVFLCSPRAALGTADARVLAERRPAGIFEGCFGACSPEAARYLDHSGLLFVPAIAAGSGGVRPGIVAAAWEAERQLRREMEALCGTLYARNGDSLCRAAYALALQNAADDLLSRGVV